MFFLVGLRYVHGVLLLFTSTKKMLTLSVSPIWMKKSYSENENGNNTNDISINRIMEKNH